MLRACVVDIMASTGIRIADWGQRVFTGLALATTVYLGVNLYSGGTKLKVSLPLTTCACVCADARLTGVSVFD